MASQSTIVINNFCSKISVYLKIIFIACLLTMTASLVFLCQEAFRKESVFISSTSKDSANGLDEDPFFPQYPRITICQTPSYIKVDNSSEQAIIEYALLALGYPFSPLTPSDSALLVESTLSHAMGQNPRPEMEEFVGRLQSQQKIYERHKASVTDFNLKQYIVNNSVNCEDIFISCIAFIFHQPCCELFVQTLTSFGVCYSLSFNEDLISIEQKTREVDFSLIFDLKPVEDFGKPTGIGYMLFVSDPRIQESLFRIQDGHPVFNGYSTKVKTRLIKNSRVALFTPWHGMWSDCPKMPPDLDFENVSERYVKMSCDKRFINRKVRMKCGCRDLMDNSDPNIPYCDPDKIYGCYLTTLAKDNLTSMNERCPLPCYDYRYESSLNFYKVGGSDNRSRLVFIYDSIQYDLHEYRVTTISSFLSQIGGVMGLYVGASIITCMEIAAYFISYLIYRFLPRKVEKTSSLSSRVTPRKAIRNKNFYFY